MKPLPEGVRRVCIVIGGLATAAWIIFVFITSDAFSEVRADEWVIVLSGAALLFFAPSAIYRTFRWIREGFAIDSPH